MCPVVCRGTGSPSVQPQKGTEPTARKCAGMSHGSLHIAVIGLLTIGQVAADVEPERAFFRAGIDTDQPVWGLREGIRFGVWPGNVADFPGPGGPRGLIRIGYPILPDGKHWLVNFIAIEPIAQGGRGRGFSELEPSTRDGEPGKFIDPGPPLGVEWEAPDDGALYPGHVEEL
jgi:hypothetical protein